ncbi:hypothetical protein RFI_13918 [Reticulomyxa filosa]|uniref:TLC domain-containing protein n=1 Tax=Reticulomyxa filosa TaxID=46433 RepID=X6NBV6_RETFI|nr:hypothetical protein RFI_13918 [Reticulomyxa filosa]|eukprot:ETO23269.1 hypothetical protein RFI_13918 [Reticulomyxa filosa]
MAEEKESKEQRISKRDQTMFEKTWDSLEKDYLKEPKFYKWIAFWSVVSFGCHQSVHRWLLPSLHQRAFLTCKDIVHAPEVMQGVPERVSVIGLQSLLQYCQSKMDYRKIPYHESAIFSNRIFNLIHNCLGVCAPFYYIYKHETTFKKATQSFNWTTPKEYVTWQYLTLGYFIVDMVYLLKYENKSSDFIFHHLLGILSICGLISYKSAGFAWKYLMVIAEMPTALLNLSFLISHFATMLNGEYLPLLEKNLKFLIKDSVYLQRIRTNTITKRYSHILGIVQILFVIAFFFVRFYFLPKLFFLLLLNFESTQYKLKNVISYGDIFGGLFHVLLIL